LTTIFWFFTREAAVNRSLSEISIGRPSNEIKLIAAKSVAEYKVI
jgi:hypothetical protein